MYCVGGGVAESGVVEDDPGFAGWGLVCRSLETLGETVEPLLVIVRIVSAGGTVETPVMEALPAAWFGCLL